MNGLPKISAVIPTLNSGRTLALCLQSIRDQDYPAEKIEIIIADAGSTDSTLEIAEKFDVDKIVGNPLKTGEAGKTAAIEASSGEVIALIDSDNIFTDRNHFAIAAKLFAEKDIDHAEPMYWTYDRTDSLVNRYCALLGMNDPVSLFLGNYNRYSYLTGKFTAIPVVMEEETEEAVIVLINEKEVPTFGANGFMIRRSVLEGLDWRPYYFDIDVFCQAVLKGHRKIAVLKTGIRHLYSDSIATFRRKQTRRIRDYFHHSRLRNRSYPYSSVPKRRYLLFILYTITIIPLLLQSIRGYLKKPDTAWFFHPLACWITLIEYSVGTIASLVKTSEYDRRGWKQ